MRQLWASASYLATDGLDTVSEALDSAGNVTAQQLYLPYGGSRYSNGTMPTSKGYTGQRADAATGLDYYGARYYDPLVGQFTSADDILPDGGFNPWGLSRYAYVEGNPIARNDPSGHCWLVCAAIAAVATFAVVTVGDAIVQQATTGHVDWGQAATAGAVAGVVVGAAIALGPLGVAAVEGLAAEGTVAGAGAAVASTAGELLAGDAAIVGAAGAAVSSAASATGSYLAGQWAAYADGPIEWNLASATVQAGLSVLTDAGIDLINHKSPDWGRYGVDAAISFAAGGVTANKASAPIGAGVALVRAAWDRWIGPNFHYDTPIAPTTSVYKPMY